MCHLSVSLCHTPLHAASYRVKAPSPKEGDYQMEDVKEVKLDSNPAYEAVTTTCMISDQADYFCIQAYCIKVYIILLLYISYTSYILPWQCRKDERVELYILNSYFCVQA